MSIKFKWEGEPPTNPPAAQVEEAFEYDLTHLPDVRSLCPDVVSVYLQQDRLKFRVEGVGYSDENSRLVTFYYSLQEPWVHWWDYYESPVRPKQSS